jgi:glycosyltransferase involved in cell wall biosynthesis
MSALTVSVALCTRNGARYVEQQVRDILSQSYPVDEVVVSDDASTDGTLDIVERVFAEVAPAATRLIVLRNEVPLGVTANFEQAVRATTGSLIALSDQDDRWRPDRVDAAVAAFCARPQLLLTHSDARLVRGDGTPLGGSLFHALEVSGSDLALIHAGRAFEVLLRRNLATGATMTFRRSLLDVAVPFPGEWVHDEWLAIVAAATGELDVLEQPLVDYRQHGANEIGAARLDLRQKVARVLASDPGRNASIAGRFRELADRLGTVPEVSAADLAALDRKVAYESARASMPASRWRRIPSIVRKFVRGDYARYASRRRWDAVRDLLRPPA